MRRHDAHSRHLFVSGEGLVQRNTPLDTVRGSRYLSRYHFVQCRRRNHCEGSVTDLDVNPSGKVMISCGRDNNVRLWDMTTSKELYSRSTKGRGYGGFRSCGSVLAAKASVMHSAMMCPFATPKVTSALFVSVPSIFPVSTSQKRGCQSRLIRLPPKV